MPLGHAYLWALFLWLSTHVVAVFQSRLEIFVSSYGTIFLLFKDQVDIIIIVALQEFWYICLLHLNNLFIFEMQNDYTKISAVWLGTCVGLGRRCIRACWPPGLTQDSGVTHNGHKTHIYCKHRSSYISHASPSAYRHDCGPFCPLMTLACAHLSKGYGLLKGVLKGQRLPPLQCHGRFMLAKHKACWEEEGMTNN